MTRKIWYAPMPGRKMDTDPTVFNKVLFPNVIRNASRLSRIQRLSRIERRWSGKNTFVIGADNAACSAWAKTGKWQVKKLRELVLEIPEEVL